MAASEAVHWLYAGVLFVVGAMVGSFLNVIAYRVPMEISLVNPPSSCPACGRRILSRDNLPIFGWLFLRGRCRFCQAPISPRYPLVELFTAVLWAVEGWRLAGMHHGYWTNVAVGLLELLFISAMVVTILVDIDYLIILDEVSIGGTVVALAASPFLPVMHHAASRGDYMGYHPLLYPFFGNSAPWLRSFAAAWIGMLVGLVLSLGLYFLGNWMFKRQIQAAREEDPEIDSALGLGDVKLMGCFGAFLGWKAVFFAFIVGSLLAAAVGGVMKLRSGDPEGETGLAGLRRRWESGNSILPFGPFLAAGALLFLFAGEPLLGLVSRSFLLPLSL